MSFKPLFNDDDLLEERDCYLIDLRNGEYSDWHDENSYELYSDDIIRWADQNGLGKFDLFGHSMGAKCAQTMSILYPDRVDAVIAFDGAPVKQAVGSLHPYYNIFWRVISFMATLEEYRDLKGLTRNDAKKLLKEEFADNRAIAAILLKNMDTKDKSLRWIKNYKTLYCEDGGDVFHFDVDLRSQRDNVYHLIGEHGPENWNFEEY